MRVTLSGTDKLKSRLQQMGLQVRFAETRAANDAALSTRDMLQEKAEAVFSGGITPYVKKGIRFRSAQVVSGGAKAEVYLSDKRGDKGQLSVSEILDPHIKGGGRARKSSERRTRPWYLVPSKHVALDRYGNVPATYMKNILSAAGFLGAQSQTDVSRKRKGLKLERGVWIKPGVGIFQNQQSFSAGTGKTSLSGPSIPLFFFVNRPQYEKTFDFYGMAKSHLKRALPAALRKQVKVSLKG